MDPYKGSTQTLSPCPVKGKTSDEQGVHRISDLVQLTGHFTELARDLNGSELQLRGYLAPSLVSDAKAVLLTEGSQAPCLLCGCVHGVGAGILIEPQAPFVKNYSLYEAVDVVGRLHLGQPEGLEDEQRRDIKLDDATVQAMPKTEASDARQWLRSYLKSRFDDTPLKINQKKISRKQPKVKSGNEVLMADTILRNGKFHLLDGRINSAEAVAIQNGRFIAVGKEGDVVPHAGPDTDIIDLKGKSAIPGLIDSHLHQIYLAINLPAVQLLDARSIAEVQSRIADRVAITEPGEWVVGTSGWHESMLAEGHMPTRWDLDEVAPDNPVIIPRGGHVVTVNSLALERAGITKDTPDPTGGVIVRDPETREATGVL
ncbi:MAG: amidohydrolase family protein, partial [Rhodospirillaceae bacterium]|nr:amidohydrolase family protein [Rhodospirillaceae bacterium]